MNSKLHWTLILTTIFQGKKRFLHLRSLLVRSTPTITYIFTKSLRLRGAQVDFICRKVVTYMLQLRGIVLELNVRFKHMYHDSVSLAVFPLGQLLMVSSNLGNDSSCNTSFNTVSCINSCLYGLIRYLDAI